LDAPKIFSQPYYERLHDVEDRHWWSRGMRVVAAALLEPFLDRERPWTVVDGGCGTGVTLEWLRGLGITGMSMGIDLSPDALAFCRSRHQTRLCRASVLSLPLPDQTVDLVTSVDVLQHLPLPDGDLQALREFHRVLRPGGILFIRSNARRRGDSDATSETDYQRYTVEKLRERLTRAGFTIERLTYANALSAWLERLTPKGRFSTANGESQTDQGLRIRCLPSGLGWVNGILFRILCGEARYLRKSERSLSRGHSTMVVARKS
jgi:ubiquinone/menaquinone biosynthesis C-methylase UbiE